jgi:hypothetical protein
VKPNINSVEVHPQLSNNGHPVDGALVGAGSLRLAYDTYMFPYASQKALMILTKYKN